MLTSRQALASLVCAAALLAPLPARAQADAAIAEKLFEDGRKLMEDGKWDEACEKFASSQRLAPAIGTQLNLALCREKQGRTATAWSLYVDVEAAATRAHDTARARFAHDHGAALVGQLKKVVIEVPTPPPGMVVQLDGTQLPAGALGTEIPLDPGDHDLVVTAPHKKKWEQSRLALGPSATTVHVRVELEDEAVAAAAPPVAVPPPAPSASAAPATTPPAPPSDASPSTVATDQPSSGMSGKMIAGIATGGAGVVLIGVGAYYGVTALSRKNAENNYPAGSPDRLTVYNQAKDAQTYGLVFGGVGVVALGVGAYLVLTSLGPSSSGAPSTGWLVVPTAGPDGAGALLQHGF